MKYKSEEVGARDKRKGERRRETEEVPWLLIYLELKRDATGQPREGQMNESEQTERRTHGDYCDRPSSFL